MEAKRKKIKNIILGVLTALAAAAMALLPMLLRAAKPGEKDASSVLTATLERNSIRTTISGGGALAGADARKIALPHGVELTAYLVKNGQSVTAGQPLAQVDRITVMKTIATVQKNLEYLDAKMGELRAPRTQETLSAPVPGRVKAVYAREGDAVSDVMARHGALLVISLDGRMAVQVETAEAAAVGEDVTVTLSDGREFPGRVERRQGNTLTVTLTDDGPAPGETARLRSSRGTELGEGELYVHAAWNLTAASGTVKNVYVRPEEKVQRGYGLCFLTGMDGSGSFEQLAAQRRDYEETLNRLFELYVTGTVDAPEDGVIAGIDEAKVGLMRSVGTDAGIVLLSAPTDPAADAPSAFPYKVAVVNSVAPEGVMFLAAKSVGSAASYEDVGVLDVVTSDLSGVKLFRFDAEGGHWGEVGAEVLTAGQLVFLIYDDTATTLTWIMLPPQTGYSVPELPMEDFTIDIGGGGGGPARPFEMYDLTQTEVMRLSPQGDMTVKVKIDEMDVLFVAPGQEAEITLDALPGRTFVGHVREIDPNGANSGGRTRYTVTITVDREEELLAGMNATAILTVGVTENILTLPVAALAEKGSRTLVYTAYDPQTRELLLPVEVETGISDGESVEIVSGLTEGQTVFYSYYETEAMPELAALPGQTA